MDPATALPRKELETVTIRFCGDSGDGMQLTGAEFTRASAIAGNDLQTFPDYPAEIRAPAGTVAGVSGFQIQLGSTAIYTSGDRPDALVAMNPAALRANLADLAPGGLLVVNTGAFTPANLAKAGYQKDPLEDEEVQRRYRFVPVDISRLTAVALEGTGLSQKEVARARNMFALGLMLWLYGRPPEPTVRYLGNRFAKKPELAQANQKALEAGLAFGESTELFVERYRLRPARLEPGLYRNVSGNEATALGLLAAARLAGLPGFLGSYPITPASDILHELSRHKNFDFATFQAEDEIAACCAAIGAAYGGALAVTTTSGPGVALKQEAIGLAVMAELPLVIVNVQRGGPSTGLPTKTEQADLFQAVLGRNGESPVPVLAASSPSDCFECAIEAARIAVQSMTPVILLSDGYIANGQEPWRVPEMHELSVIDVHFRSDSQRFLAYRRDEERFARDWVRPGTPGLTHRIGGLEKDFLTGAVSYDPQNHERMVRVRASKVARISATYPPLQLNGNPDAEVVVVGWGSTCGAITQAVNELRAKGRSVASLHLRYLNPLPDDLGAILRRARTVLVPELNLGQLVHLLRARFLVPAQAISKIQGKPFSVAELTARIEEHLPCS